MSFINPPKEGVRCRRGRKLRFLNFGSPLTKGGGKGEPWVPLYKIETT